MSSESIRFFAATDVGVVRDHNEDNFLVDKKLGIFIVADGMGGHAAGEVASAMAVRTVHEEVKAEGARIAQFAQDPNGHVSKNDIAALMEHAVQSACSKINEVGMSDPAKRGMGTTLSALLVIGGIGFIAHVGDSRIYMVREGVVQQVTEDHTVYNELIRKGKLNAEQLKKVESKKNALMRAVGVYERVDVDTLVLEIVAGDSFILASDGLTQYLASPDELLPYATGKDSEKAPKMLCEVAKARGGSDNITVILVQVVSDADEAAVSRATQVSLKRAVLAKVPIFARLDQRELLRVMQVADTRSFGATEVLIREGERGDELYIVLSGKVVVSRGGATLTHLGQGQNFGEMALIRSVPRSATVVAEEPSEMLVIRRSDFFELLRREHQLGLKMLWAFVGVLADRLDQTSGELRDAKQELAAEEIEAIPDTQEWNSPFSIRDRG